MKKGREEPDASKAAAVSVDFIDEYNTDRFNPVIHDFVKKLPGVTSKNMYSILNRVNSLTELLTCSQEELGDIMGSASNAESLYQSLHAPARAITEENRIKADQRYSGNAVIGTRGAVGKKLGSNRFKTNVSKK